MSDLVEFLVARIAEDEAACLTDAYFGQPTMDDPAPLRMDFDEMLVGPRRWLAECEAKRRIVKRHAPKSGEFWRASHAESPDDDPADGLACACCGTWEEYGVPWPCGTLRDLAAVYADHPDYRDDWRP